MGQLSRLTGWVPSWAPAGTSAPGGRLLPAVKAEVALWQVADGGGVEDGFGCDVGVIEEYFVNLFEVFRLGSVEVQAVTWGSVL